MNWLRTSSAIYRRLLIFYPPELHSRFGDEMVLVFSEQTREAWQVAGVAGLGRVWVYATWELATVALPQRVLVPAVIGRAVAIVCASALFLGLLRALAPITTHYVK